MRKLFIGRGGYTNKRAAQDANTPSATTQNRSKLIPAISLNDASVCIETTSIESAKTQPTYGCSLLAMTRPATISSAKRDAIKNQFC